MTEREVRPIIVGGVFRSGTSLVRRLLDAHSRIHCGPEVMFFRDFYGDYIKDDLAHLRFFSSVRFLGLSEEKLLTTFGSAFMQTHEDAARIAGKPRWADKNPENVMYLRQWELLLPRGFFFVQVVRSPLDVLASLKETPFPKTVPADFGARVKLYQQYRWKGEEYARLNPDRSITVEYEDLVANPEAVLEKLFCALGEQYESGVLSSFASRQSAGGLEDPKVGRTLRIHHSSVGRWRSDLTDQEAQYAVEHLNEWMHPRE